MTKVLTIIIDGRHFKFPEKDAMWLLRLLNDRAGQLHWRLVDPTSRSGREDDPQKRADALQEHSNMQALADAVADAMDWE